MADVAVVTDSIGYLPAALTDSLGITVMSPQYYDLGAGWLRESEFDGDYGLLYAQLDASKSMATTSPVTAEEFVGVFDRLLQQHSAVVSVLVSSGISKTCSNARQAAAQLGGRGGERVVVLGGDRGGAAGRAKRSGSGSLSTSLSI